MPAKRPYRPFRDEDKLEIRVEGNLERRRKVYFTDQEPCFKITAENTGDKRIEGRTHSRLSFEESPRDYERREHQTLELDLEPGEKAEFEHNLDMLAYQGSGAITIDEIRLRDRNGKYEISRDSGRLFRVYTFVVYDREYYKVNYLLPRWGQYGAAGLAVLIVLVGIIQIYTAI